MNKPLYKEFEGVNYFVKELEDRELYYLNKSDRLFAICKYKNGMEYYYNIWLDEEKIERFEHHRLTGPARIFLIENKLTFEWYLWGEKIKCSSQQEFEKYLKLKCFS